MTTPVSTTHEPGTASDVGRRPEHVPIAPAWVRRLAPAARWWLRADVAGAGQLPTTGGVLVAATHASHLDSVVLGGVSPRPLLFLGDERLEDWRLLGRALPRVGLVPVRRGSGDTAALDRVLGFLAAGHAVVLYPEGGRSRDGQVYRPRSGIARLATAAGCPVVPAGLDGTADVWPVDRPPRLRRGPVRVRFGPPLAPPEATPVGRRAFLTDLHRRLVELSGRPRGEGFRPDPQERSP